MRPYTSRVIVSTPGKAMPLSNTSLRVNEFHAQALAENTGYICMGDMNVRARAGERNSPHMDAGETFSWKESTDLSWWWIDASIANEGICILATIGE